MRLHAKTLWIPAAVALLALALAAPALALSAGGERASGWGGGFCQGVGSMAGSLAELFGMSSEELAQAREEGQSLSEIGEDRGIGEDRILESMLETRKAALDEAVADGRISQERADAMLDRMEGRMKDRLDQPAGGGCAGQGDGSGDQSPRQGGGCGMGGPGSQGAPSAEATAI